MLSLYIHIPFCTQKCAYCAFTSFPDIQKEKIDNYLNELKKEIEKYGKEIKEKEIRTIYLGGGTPSSIGSDNILKIIEIIKTYFNLEDLEEFSMEMNPFPQEEVFKTIKTLNKKLKEFPRIRFSFGIQSFDDEVLKESGRPYNYPTIINFLRDLREIKQDNNVFNFDFIAFGKFNTTRSGELQLRDQHKLQFFSNFVNSGLADSFSLYTLELSKGSQRFKTQKEDSDAIHEEFSILKEILSDAGYARYEISNFSLPGKNSIHNMVYRNMENYLGLGLGSSSYLKDSTFGTRYKNTENLGEYLSGNYQKEKNPLTKNDYLIEKFFLGLRTKEGIKDIEEFKEVLVPEHEKKIKSYEKQGLMVKEGGKIHLTDTGMDLSNNIITDLLKEV